MSRQVHKFGGSSLLSAERYRAVASIIKANSQPGDVVVVSASGKTTDKLVALVEAYNTEQAIAFAEKLQAISGLQSELITELLEQPVQDEILSKLQAELAEIKQQAEQRQLNEAQVLAQGELWSARLLAAYLQQSVCAATDVDARDIIKMVDGQVKKGISSELSQQVLSSTEINVVTGFIASDLEGNTLTLGRNGSDYSATLMALFIQARSVTIWTDTQGIFSTDPRAVSEAEKYDQVCRAQASCLSRLGNPVLHAKTLSPLKNTDIELSVRSSYAPDSEYTRVVKAGDTCQKRFLTTLHNQALIKADTLEEGELGSISRAIQHTVCHFEKQGTQYLLVPQQDAEQVVELLEAQAEINQQYISVLGMVHELGAGARLISQALEELEKQQQQVINHHIEQDHGFILLAKPLEADLLDRLHQQTVLIKNEVALIVAGTGNVGETFLQQLNSQIEKLNQTRPVKLVGLIRSKGVYFDYKGIDISDWRALLETQIEAVSDKQLVDKIRGINATHKVLIDITASEQFSELYPAFVDAGCNLISANKFAGTAEKDWFHALKSQLQQRQLKWRYNTSVGAGLPINFALRDLQVSGDTVTKIAGVFSGTLSWLCGNYDGNQTFSDLVLQAKEMGYTEPDPREDLSGRDVQRKLLILARELNLHLDLDEIELTPMMPEQLAEGSWQDFIERRGQLDNYIEQLQAKADEQEKVLRYVAEVKLPDDAEGKITARVGVQAVDKSSALANLVPGDNIFVVQTQWYLDNPLVIQGPGAGKEVTASGIHSDLYWLINDLSIN